MLSQPENIEESQNDRNLEIDIRPQLTKRIHFIQLAPMLQSKPN